MAWIVADSFDYYAPYQDLAHSVWDAMPGGNPGFTSGRFPGSQALNCAWGDNLLKNLSSNEPIIYITFAWIHMDSLSGSNTEVYWKLQDAGTVQCTVVMMSDGSIVLKRGSDTSSTWITQYVGAFSQSLWTHFQIKIVLSATAGEFHVRKNGALTDSFSATGLNTLSTANAYCNSIMFGKTSFAAGNGYVDDLLIFSASGAAPNNWVGDCRGICLMPVADTATKAFLPVPVSTPTYAWGSAQLSQNWGANLAIATGTVTPARGGLIQNVTLAMNGAVTGHMKVAFYWNDGPGGAPGTVWATSNEVLNPVNGNNTFTFPAGTWLSQQRRYYLAILCDAAYTVQDNGYADYWTVAQPYGSGFPAGASFVHTPGGGSLRAPYWTVTLMGNCFNLGELTANGDTDYVQSANVNDEDLYQVDQLTFPPYAILGIVTHLYIRKSDAGTRQAQLRLKSGATEVGGVDTPVSSSWQYLARVDPTDPNTGAAWTQAALNALLIGHKVTL
jgi:hypothetical protein